jgi:hypothetical protein
MNFPVILEHSDACAELHGKKVKIPTIAATAVILASRGADQLYVPCPSEYELERIQTGITLLPKERRACVRIIDRNGSVLKSVRKYLKPLVEQARGWPEDAFVNFSESFLYQLALGAKHRSGVLANSVEVLRGFVPIIRPDRFNGEARFRLAELVALICGYEPHVLDHGSFQLHASSRESFSPDVWSLLDNTQFRAVTSASGKLGFLKHPLVGLKRLQRVIRTFFGRKETRKLLTLAATAAELAGAGSAAKTAENFFETLVGSDASSFRPPFLSLGAAELGIYRASLADTYPKATPPRGTIMVLENSRGGKMGHSWLSVGEENKLELEAEQAERSKKRYLEAKAAQRRFSI